MGVLQIINTGRNWIYGILLAVVVVFILLAAWNFMISGGEENKLKKAKGMMRNAIIALIVGILSASIVLVIPSFFDATSGQRGSSNNTPNGEQSGKPTSNGSLTPATPIGFITEGCSTLGCLPGQVCNYTTGQCVWGSGSGKYCASDAVCPSGENCVQNTCIKSTGTQYKLQNGQQCSGPSACQSGYCNQQNVCAENPANNQNIGAGGDCTNNPNGCEGGLLCLPDPQDTRRGTCQPIK